MNDDTNKEQNQVVDNNTNVEVNNESESINETGVVEEVSFNYPEKEEVEETKEEQKQEANTVVDTTTTVNNTTTLEEVSAGSDSSLEVTEVSSDSVFKEKEETPTGAMKEGQELVNQKKGFPYGMVIIFVILIICAFFIDNIVGFIEDVVMNKDEALIEEKKKDDELDMKNEANKKEDIASENDQKNS